MTWDDNKNTDQSAETKGEIKRVETISTTDEVLDDKTSMDEGDIADDRGKQLQVVELSNNSDENIPVITPELMENEDSVDESLVDAAVKKVTDILLQHEEAARIEVADYLLEVFYGGDLERVKMKKPINEKSFLRFYERLREQGEVSKSKSWFYERLNVMVQDEEYKSFQTYRNLSVSKKVLLLPVDDRKQKEELIEMAVDEQWTARELKQNIKNIHKEDTGLLGRVRQPGFIVTHDVREEFTESKLQALSNTELAKMKTSVEGQLMKYRKQISESEATIEKYQILDELIKAVKMKMKESK